MKFSVNRESLLKPLQQVAGVVERRNTLPVLSNLLLRVDASGKLDMTGTDLEVEVKATVAADVKEGGETTIPARKLGDLCREIPANAQLDFGLADGKVTINSGQFRSSLSTFPADEFPTADQSDAAMSAEIESKEFKRLLDSTAFAMAQQDVRYFLNGMLIELGEGRVRSVATDGHRLAMSDLSQSGLEDGVKQVIVPRKGVMEITRLLADVEEPIKLSVGANHLNVSSPAFSLTTKLIDAKYPDYGRVIPKGGTKVVTVERELLRHALARIAVLSNEKYRSIRAAFSGGQLQLSTNNPEREEAEETIEVQYDGDALEMGFNVTYIQDVLMTLASKEVRITLIDASSSAVIEDPEKEDAVYVVMPMKL